MLNRFQGLDFDLGEAIDALPGLARAGGRKLRGSVPPTQAVEREMEALARLGGRMLVFGEPDYPPLLALLDGAGSTHLSGAA